MRGGCPEGPTKPGYDNLSPLFQGGRRFLRQGVRGNQNPLLISPLNASQGGESIASPRARFASVVPSLRET